MSTLMQMTMGIMSMDEVHGISDESPGLLVVLVAYMVVVQCFFFNLLVSQFCGVYSGLAEDVQGYAMLARAEVILDTLRAVPM
mmetsp:Transcript_4700/g.5362  ORF Transcript_4700/g.5362 Transcript_4700/m.5362 type:complete len:83 (+) Transcript_4700:3-251(+)